MKKHYNSQSVVNMCWFEPVEDDIVMVILAVPVQDWKSLDTDKPTNIDVTVAL